MCVVCVVSAQLDFYDEVVKLNTIAESCCVCVTVCVHMHDCVCDYVCMCVRDCVWWVCAWLCVW